MKKIIAFLTSTIVTISFIGQGINDSISMEAGYTNQVFYSLENGTITSVDNSNWDIALAVSGQGAKGSAILFNDAYGTLYKAPVDTSAWQTLDTAGIDTWEILLNSDTSWTNGAFNKYRGAAGNFDMGWGILNPSNNFWTFGDSLYVAKINDGSYKKVWILSLKTGVWQFKYANLDGSNEQTQTITKTDYPNRNFIYFSMSSSSIIDREPDNSTWDLTFTKHKDYLTPPGMFLNVTSAFTNRNVWTAKAHEVDLNAALNSTTPQTPFTQNVNNIGREWKKFSSQNGGWSVRDSIAYFIYDEDSVNYYRLVFTGFEGSSTGKAFFNKEKLGITSIHNNGVNNVLSLYPNPANNEVSILIHTNKEQMANFAIFDLTGKMVLNKTLQLAYGSNVDTFKVSTLPKGIYIVNIKNKNINYTQRLIIR